MDYKDYLAIAAIALCTLLNAGFSLAETALVMISRARLQHLGRDEGGASEAGGEDRSPQSAEPIRWLIKEPTRVVAAVQIGLTVFSLTSVAIAIALLSPDLARFLGAHHVEHNVRIAVVSLVVVLALVTLVIGEIVPRAIAARYPEQVAVLVAQPLKWLERLERPIVALILGLSNLIVRPFGMTASFRAPMITEDELRTILETSQQEGVIQEEEKEMLHNVISFGDTLIHKVMTPRVHIRGIDAGDSIDKLINLIVDHGHSRIPVYEGGIDNVLGVIHAKDLLPSLARGQRIGDLRLLMRVPLFVPEQMRTDELLERMRRSNMQLAIVQDEYGGTAGLVTIEDLLEEIVGEIQDEYDVEQPQIVFNEHGAALVDARMSIEDLNDELDLSLPTTDFDTVGGFVFGLFGRPPLVDDSIETLDGSPSGDLIARFTVIKADGHRLQLLKIETRPADEDENKPKPVVDAGAEAVQSTIGK